MLIQTSLLLLVVTQVAVSEDELCQHVDNNKCDEEYIKQTCTILCSENDKDEETFCEWIKPQYGNCNDESEKLCPKNCKQTDCVTDDPVLCDYIETAECEKAFVMEQCPIKCRKPAIVCEHPWFLVDNQCFRTFQSDHSENTLKLDWFSAITYCHNQAPNGNLAQPKDLCLLAGIIGKKDNSTNYWLGGSDLANKKWIWRDGTKINDNGWQSDQPETDNGHCLTMWPEQVDKILDKDNCENIQPLANSDCKEYLPFVCERH